MAGAWMPLLAGRVFDMAGMYAIFAVTVQFAPDTFGRSMEGEAGIDGGAMSGQPA